MTIQAPPRLLTGDVRAARWRQAGFVALMLCAGFLTNPDRPLPFDVCLWRRWTGWSCPTCGLTRAICHALHGDWSGSVALHPAGPLALAALVTWAVWSALEAWRGQPLRAEPWMLRRATAILR